MNEISVKKNIIHIIIFLSMVSPIEIALAHAKLLKSDPPQRSEIRKSPAYLQLWFNENLEPAFAIATVSDSNGMLVTQKPAEVAKNNQKLLILQLPNLKPDTYEVKFQVLSIDGHTVESDFKFTVKANNKK